MRSGKIPFQFAMDDMLQKCSAFVNNRVGDVTISLPFVSFSVSPKARERQVARELIIRLMDRRVLSASECCDDCIDNALKSLQEIRRTLVDKQVELSEMQSGALFLLIETMSLGIRQFMTFEQRLRHTEDVKVAWHDSRREPVVRQQYFDGLEVLRGHLSRCIRQVAIIAGMELPRDGLVSNYQDPWQKDAYVCHETITDQREQSSN